MEVKKVVRMEQYRQKSNNRPKKRLKKKFKGFFFSLFIILIVGSVFYFTSSISKLSMVYFEGLNYVSRSELMKLSGLSYQDRFLTLDTQQIAKDILKHPLITDVNVKKKGINQLSVEVQEKDVIGCVEMNGGFRYVLSDGQLVEEDQSVKVTCQGTVIYGLTEEALKNSILSLFIQSVTKLDPIFVNLIKEIRYEPMYGDINRFSLFLKDGNTVNVNSYSMVNKLKYYQTMVDKVSSLYEGVKGTYHLDVGDHFEPYTSEEKVLLSHEMTEERLEE
ncbi:MAG: FtsQ-type POTRA domain-containing protein [Turicibacter sp.]|nr:FtsQ-type POTRA domain-containing protein [Turicibacter sp.]